MRFQTPLVSGRLIRRYKRFLADVLLDDGREITAHCANPGSMMGLKDEGIRVWLEPNDDPKKKLKFGWRLVDHENGHFTGVDTSLPNRALKAALMAGEIPEVADYPMVRPEVKYGENSRVDFHLSGSACPDLWLEVKSVTLSREPGLAEFPDSVTTRGTKHLNELAARARKGDRAMLFYLVQRTDCTRVTLAQEIDPTYASAFRAAQEAGLEVLAYDCAITTGGIALRSPLPFVFS